jgi:hypothetical protein
MIQKIDFDFRSRKQRGKKAHVCPKLDHILSEKWRIREASFVVWASRVYL